MAQIGARTPITVLNGYAVINPMPAGWKRLSDIAAIPAECTGAILQALDGPVIWMQSPGAMPANPTGFTLPKTDYLTLEEFTQVSQLCIDTTASSKFSVQFYTGPIGALPQVTDPVAASSGGGGGGGGVQSVDGFFPLASTGGENPTIWVPDNGITLEQLQDLITSFNLTPGWDYQLQNATSQNLRIIVRALTVNTISKRVEMVDDSFDRCYYDINTDVLECFDDISCTVESDGTNWVMKGEPAFLPRGVASVQPSTGLSFSVNYARTNYTHVVSSLLSGSRSLCLDQWSLGTSNRLGNVSCIVSNRFISANLVGPSFLIPPGNPAVQNAVWSSGMNGLLIAVDAAESNGAVSAASQSPAYRCIATNINTSTILVQFVDSAGVVATSPDAEMKLNLQRNAPMILDAAKFFSRANQPSKAWVSVRVTMMKRMF